jgi:4-hydroxy-tetrahydrodipicolinate synthase
MTFRTEASWNPPMNTSRKSFAGLIVPMLTPLDDKERIDVYSLGRLVNFLIESGVHGIFVLGSTGEGPSLRADQRRILAIETVKAAAGRVPILGGVLEPSTARVIDEMERLADCGLSAYVATTPYYFSGHSQAELATHFRTLAANSPLPILLYNIPQNTRLEIRRGMLLDLVGHPNIVGLKDSSGNWPELQAFLLNRDRPRDFVVLQGVQTLSTVSLIAGCDGLVPGQGNISPRLLLDLLAAAQSGDLLRAFALQAQLDTLVAQRGRAFIHANKLMASSIGLIDDNVSASLPRLNADEAKLLLANLQLG